MDRGRASSLPPMARTAGKMPVEGGIPDCPFWSERARTENILAHTRPQDLPKVPSEISEGKEGAELPIQDKQSHEKGPSGESKSSAARTVRKGRSRSPSRSQGPLPFRTPPSSWMSQPPDHQSQWFVSTSAEKGANDPRGHVREQVNPSPANPAVSELERELEKSIVERMYEENARLKEEIERMKATSAAILEGLKDGSGKSGTMQSWSEVSYWEDGSVTPPPPPPPSSSPPRHVAPARYEHPRHTPGGTMVPRGQPPSDPVSMPELPCLPPLPVVHPQPQVSGDQLDFSGYEMAPGNQWMKWLGPPRVSITPPKNREMPSQTSAVDERCSWLEGQVEGLRQLIESQSQQ